MKPSVSSLGEPPVRPAAKPLPRYSRASDSAPEIVVMERDVAVLEDVWRLGLLTTSQIEILRSVDPKEPRRFVSRLTLTRRLKLLYHNRYLRRIARPQPQGSLEMVYVLDTEGARTLSLQHGEVRARVPSRLPRAAALDHQLEIVQFRVALTAAARLDPAAGEAGLHLVEWLPGEKVRFRVQLEAPGQRRQGVSIIPDAGIIFRAEQRRHYAFLEVDRGTEPQRTLAAKARAYAEYFQSGGFADDFSVPRGLGFWVLFVAPTPKRTQTILKAVSACEGPRMLFRVAEAGEIAPERMAAPAWTEGGAGGKCRFWQLAK